MIGVDIESIERFRGLTREKDRNFLEKIYTEKELNYCFSKAEPASHLAARFCAKEAVKKAYCALTGENVLMSDVEIENSELGVPHAKIKGVETIDINISMSHCEDKAIGFAQIIKK